MGYMTDGLTFNTLRRASAERLGHFRNNKGKIAHTQADGSDWSLNDWMVAVAGELGEAANVLKKVRRGDLTARRGAADARAGVCRRGDLPGPSVSAG